MNLVKNLNTTTREILDTWDITEFEALQIAVQVQKNELFAQANVLHTPTPVPSALEAISMSLDRLSDAVSMNIT